MVTAGGIYILPYQCQNLKSGAQPSSFTVLDFPEASFSLLSILPYNSGIFNIRRTTHPHVLPSKFFMCVQIPTNLKLIRLYGDSNLDLRRQTVYPLGYAAYTFRSLNIFPLVVLSTDLSICLCLTYKFSVGEKNYNKTKVVFKNHYWTFQKAVTCKRDTWYRTWRKK